MMENELKPCPFCGGYAHIDKTSSMTCFRDAAIYCEGCNSWYVLDAFSATEEDLIDAWNRRVNDG
jgi:Lar family restriction alleviation protein